MSPKKFFIVLVISTLTIIGTFLLGMEGQKFKIRKETQNLVTIRVPATGGYFLRTPVGTEMQVPNVGGAILTLGKVETGTILDSK